MYTPTQLRYNLRIIQDRPKNLSDSLVFAVCESFDPAISTPVVEVGGRCVIVRDAWLAIEVEPDAREPTLVSVDATSIVELYRE